MDACCRGIGRLQLHKPADERDPFKQDGDGEGADDSDQRQGDELQVSGERHTPEQQRTRNQYRHLQDEGAIGTTRQIASQPALPIEVPMKPINEKNREADREDALDDPCAERLPMPATDERREVTTGAGDDPAQRHHQCGNRDRPHQKAPDAARDVVQSAALGGEGTEAEHGEALRPEEQMQTKRLTGGHWPHKVPWEGHRGNQADGHQKVAGP